MAFKIFLAFGLYRLLTILLLPLMPLWLWIRQRRGKELPGRQRERFGRATQPRPAGPVIWIHAASVGEVRSAAALIRSVHGRYPGATLLLTTTTVTAALDCHSLPELRDVPFVHQFFPLDTPGCVRRFIHHWQPTAVLWFESELWPQCLHTLRARSIPVVLVNGRLSDRSYGRWKTVPTLAANLLNSFSLLLAQSPESQKRLQSLTDHTVGYVGNLKYATPPLAFCEEERSRFAQALGNRPVWVAASSHPGEEALILEVHHRLLHDHPDLLTFLAPRHPARMPELLALSVGNVSGRRSRGDLPSPQQHLYWIDTIGDLGLFYALSPIVCVCGSFMPIGGHNIIEPAHFGAATVVGPHMENFRDVLHDFRTHNACVQLTALGNDALVSALTAQVADWLKHPQTAQAYGQRALAVAHAAQGSLTRVMEVIAPRLTNAVHPSLTVVEDGDAV